MYKGVVARGPLGDVVLVDSITQADAGQAGCVVVSGSHGGWSSAQYALAQPLLCAVFNDAGVGKDDAGVVALTLLQAQGRAAAVVAHTSARIGDSRDTWRHGRLSQANAAAQALGARPGMTLREWLQTARDGTLDGIEENE